MRATPIRINRSGSGYRISKMLDQRTEILVSPPYQKFPISNVSFKAFSEMIRLRLY